MTTTGSKAAADALLKQAREAYRAGRLREAQAQLEQVVAADPESRDALYLLGRIAFAGGRSDHAVALLRRAVTGSRKSADVHLALGVALLASGELAEAEKSLRRALGLRPADSTAHSNLGEALRRQERAPESETSQRRAIALDASNANAHYNLGVLLYETGREAEAVGSFRRALALAPQNATYHTHLAFALLGAGRLEEGWREYEWRFGLGDKGALLRRFPQRAWQGESLDGRSLLVWMEEGIGDQIIFASLLPELVAGSARCTIECAPKLCGLFRSSFPRAEVVPQTDTPDERGSVPELQVAAGSAARWLRPALERFSGTAGHLQADPGRVSYWRERFRAPGPGLKVGFSWRSRDLSGRRALACTRLDQWGPILAVPGVRFVCLQYDECAAELENARQAFGVGLDAFPEVDLFNDLSEAAALTRAVDLVITAPTAVSMLAAGVGVETWQMGYGRDWKTLGTGSLPWLPALVPFDRRPGQPWEALIRDVAAKLAERVGGGG